MSNKARHERSEKHQDGKYIVHERFEMSLSLFYLFYFKLYLIYTIKNGNEIRSSEKRGRPRKVQIQETASDASTKSAEDGPDPEQQQQALLKARAAKKLQYKYDHIDEVREQQNLRYQQIMDQLQLQRLSHTIFSEKFTDEQRTKLAQELSQWTQRMQTLDS